MECGGCADCVTILFDEIAPSLVTNNRYVFSVKMIWSYYVLKIDG